MARRTKIVATLGPATERREELAAVLQAGADVIRLNLSHGPLEDHLAALAMIRELAASIGRPVGVLVDLPGPKIRSGEFPDDGVELVPGSSISLVAGDGPSDATCITVGYDELLDDVDAGDRVVLGDGSISMRVVEVTPHALRAEIESGGRAIGRPGVHLSCERLQMRAPTEQDLRLAEAAAAAGVEYVALSFVRRAEDVHELRAVVGDRAGIVAKIETSAALAELPAIAAAADALMVARGDLGIDCPLEDVPHLQKRIIRHCVEVGRPVITATQMLESMIDAQSPTRAEVSDVANAVFDGTDAVMLSGETAIGHDPSGVVATMARIAARAESEASYRQWAEVLGQRQSAQSTAGRITAAMTHAAWQAAVGAEATAILCCTRSGRTARAMARFRPACRLIGLSPDPRTVAALTLSWGVESVHVEEYRTTDEMVWFAVETALQHGFVARGDTALVLAGAPDRLTGAAADILRIVRVE
ncbi:MAG: pyruvate kinase [Ilumatobacteraceae bacterium]